MNWRMCEAAAEMRATIGVPSLGSTGPSANASASDSAQPVTIESGLFRSWATTPANEARLSRSARSWVTSRKLMMARRWPAWPGSGLTVISRIRPSGLRGVRRK